MLRIILTEDNSKVIDRVKPLSLSIEMSLDIPAHYAEVILPYKKYNQCGVIDIFDDEEKVFHGIVDEEITILNSTGKFLKYTARSAMAMLIDNEACPCEYCNPTGYFLGNQYLLPMGIPHNGSEKRYSGTITVEKGMSVYDVIYTYCNQVNGTRPFIGTDGKFDFFAAAANDEICFSNKKGIRYMSLTLYNRRCNRISRVHIKLNDTGYNAIEENKETADSLIMRERYVDGTFGADTTLLTADRIIDNSNRKSLAGEIVCPGRGTDYLGYTAVIDYENICETKFIISEIRYVYNSKKENTTFILERKI